MKKLQEKLNELGISISLISEKLRYSRPTIYKYIEQYDCGNLNNIDNGVKEFFDYVSGNVTKDDVMRRIYDGANEVKTIFEMPNYVKFDPADPEYEVLMSTIISKDNIDLYRKYTQLPSEFEYIRLLIKNENYGEAIDIAFEKGLNRLRDLLLTEEPDVVYNNWATAEYNDLKMAFLHDEKLFNEDSRTSAQYDPIKRSIERLSSARKDSDRNTTHMIIGDILWGLCNKKTKLRQVINCKNIEFFKIACDSDKNQENLDYALEKVDQKRLNVLKILIDNGALYHSHHSTTDEDGEVSSFSSGNKAGTEAVRILINRALEADK